MSSIPSSTLLDLPYQSMRNTVLTPAVDGEVDGFSQGQKGDCWFLSAVLALSQTPEGRDIIDESIQAHPDGSYTVTFRGAPDYPITISAKEYAEAKKQRATPGEPGWSTGDPDMLILELAAEKLVQAHPEILPTGKTGTITRGGEPKDALFLLTGTPVIYQETGAVENTRAFFTRAFLLENEATLDTTPVIFDAHVKWPSPYPVEKGTLHSFVLTDIDSEAGTVTFINPWNSKQPITMDMDKFCNLVIRFTPVAPLDTLSNSSLVPDVSDDGPIVEKEKYY
ncbi:MAG: hypothetical protein HC848_03170 [Limnobacter sp.]|nr:hypothetical protein [Limnobacter sp.]